MLLVASGIDFLTAARLMDCSDTAMVPEVCVRVVPGNAVRATKALGGMLYGSAGTTAVVMPFASLGLLLEGRLSRRFPANRARQQKKVRGTSL